MGFAFTIACTHRFSQNTCICTQVYWEQSHMPWFFALLGGLSVDGWVWMIVESSWMLLESIYTPLSDQRLLSIRFLKIFLSFIFYFCFEISELRIFYLGSFLGCCLWVVVESEGCRVIFLLSVSFNSKYKNILLFA